MEQLQLFDQRIHNYSDLSIHQRINWKSWNSMSDNWPDIFYTIANAIYRLNDWYPKPSINDKRFARVAPLVHPRRIQGKFLFFNSNTRHDYH